MIMATFLLIPTVYAGGNLPMEYTLLYTNLDKRTQLYKSNRKNIYNPVPIMKAIQECKGYIKNDRLLFPNGQAAYLFKKTIEERNL